MNGGWAAEVAHRLHQSHPIRHRNEANGKVVIFAECSTCTKEEEFFFNKRLPPEAIAKKMQQKGWDTRKRRCPKCVQSGRRTRRHQESLEPQPPRGALQEEINRLFKKEEPLPIIQLGSHMDVKIGVTDKKMSLLIPRDSQFIRAFMSEAFKSNGHWSIDLIQDSPQEEPLVRVKRTILPPGKERAYGVVSGTYNSTTEQFQLEMAKSGIPGIQTLGEFGRVPARLVRQEQDAFLFRLPTDRPAVGNFGKRSSVETMKEIVQPSPAPTPQTIEEPKKTTITLKQAIELINRYKDERKDELELSITDNGKLRARTVIEYGDIG